MGLTYRPPSQADSLAIIPAPLVTINKQIAATPDGTKLSANYTISLEGSLLPNRGSPNSTGGFPGAFATTSEPADQAFTSDNDKFNSILRKQELLRQLFSEDGGILEWVSPSGPAVQSYPTLISIDFTPGTWVERCEYRITLAADRLFGSAVDHDDFGDFDDYNIRSASDQLSLKELEDGSQTYELTRTITATAFQRFSASDIGTHHDPTGVNINEPWEYAKEWVRSVINTSSYNLTSIVKDIVEDRTIQAVGVDEVGTYTPYSRTRTEQIDKLAGSYTYTETWTLARNSAIEEVTYSHNSKGPNITGANDGLGQRNTYSVSGTIRGLASAFDSSAYAENTASPTLSSKYNNALTYFNANILKTSDGSDIYSNLKLRIANAFTTLGITAATFANKRPLIQTISKNTRTGVITFEFQFDDVGSLNSTVFSDLTINVNENFDEEVIAEIPIPGRANGPIIQDIGTQTPKKRSVSASFNLAAKSTGSWTYSDISAIRSEAKSILKNAHNIKPTGTQGTNFWVSQLNDNLDYINGTYQMNVTFTIKGTAAVTDF